MITLAVGSAAFFGTAGRADAGLTLTVMPSSPTVKAGGSGSFEMILSNTGPTAVNIATFNYELSVLTSSPLTFTGVSSATVIKPYMFGGNGTGILGIANPAGASTDYDVSDVLSTVVPMGSAISLAAGASDSLGLISFSIAAGAKPQSIAIGITNDINVTFVASTNFGTITPIAIGTLTAGTVVIPSAVPEPASIVMALVGLGLSGAFLRQKTRPTVRV